MIATVLATFTIMIQLLPKLISNDNDINDVRSHVISHAKMTNKEKKI